VPTLAEAQPGGKRGPGRPAPMGWIRAAPARAPAAPLQGALSLADRPEDNRSSDRRS
jgi:hypothetical protein